MSLLERIMKKLTKNEDVQGVGLMFGAFLLYESMLIPLRPYVQTYPLISFGLGSIFFLFFTRK